MSWDVVARKDVQDAARSYWLWGLSLLFVVFFTVPAFFFADRVGQLAREQGQELHTDSLLPILAEVNAFFVPIVAIVLAYSAISGERDHDTLKLMLSLPHSRFDVVAGKVVGRGTVVLAALLAGFLAAGIAFAVLPVTFGAGNYVLFALLTGLLALAFVGLAVGFSAAADTDRWAMIGTVGTYVVFTLFWNRFTDGLLRLLTDHAGLEGAGRVKFHLVSKVLNPTQGYKALVYSINKPTADQLGQNVSVSGTAFARSRLVGGSGFQGQFRQQMYAQTLGTDVPFYLSDPFLVLLLLGWIVATPLLGYYVFRESDL